MTKIKINKNLLALAIRIILSVALILCALRIIDWEALTHSNILIQPEYLFAGYVAIVCSFLCAALRWYYLIKIAGFEGGLFNCILLYFSAGLINQGLPSSLGGDGYRAIKAASFIKKEKLSKIKELNNTNSKFNFFNFTSDNIRISIAVVFVDRIIGLIGNNLVGSIGLIIGGYKIAIWGEELGYIIFCVTLTIIFLSVMILHIKSISLILYRLCIRSRTKNLFFVIQSSISFNKIFIHGILAIAIHLLNILAFGFCLKALGEGMSFVGLMIGLPLISLLMMLPISVSGWGIREVTLFAVLSLWDVNSSLIVLASVSYGLLTLVSLIPGIYFLLRDNNIKFNNNENK